MESVKLTNQKGGAINSVSIADTAPLRLRGLLGRDKLTDEQGLLITPCNSVHTFGMKYAIDVVYLNKHNQVIKLVRELSPRRLSWCLRAKKVLELAPGSAHLNNINQGDTLSW
ncbi:DUF192 domain-containing protein [Shewanella maritima]|uniref:DUF192 domain-containing protein n=1 Tax=Shewanella maritima TaxID=2520507 RepID=A0A411PG40_9GAMM|nr:DUF192 domain-containing protein [Shewanella maritima]QBF82521.1 DUF192 domain-containing protein [Shewanella maritima]